MRFTKSTQSIDKVKKVDYNNDIENKEVKHLDEWDDDDLKKMMEDCRITRKRNRIALILSVIAMAINLFRIITILIGAME